MKRFLLAFQFLTIIPIKKMGPISEEDAGGASAFFPLVGMLQGILTVSFAALFVKFLPHDVASACVVLVMITINGGLHLDGLADTFDALASRKNRERKLAIMKDSAIGAFGVMAIVLAILLKYLLLDALLNLSLVTYYSSLFLAPAISRWTMVAAIFHGKSAKQDGLGKTFIEHTGKREFLIAALLTVLPLLLLLPLVPYPLLLASFLLTLLVLYIFCHAAVWISNKNFGGMTGDTFGAVSEISEILFLLSVIIWSQKFI